MPSSRLAFRLCVEAGVDIVNVFLIHPFFGKTEAFAEALEVHDFTGPQELDHVIYVRIIGQTQDVVIGNTSFLLCCNHIRTTF